MATKKRTAYRTRFQRQLVPSNSLDRLNIMYRSTARQAKVIGRNRPARKLGIHGQLKRDSQYTMGLTFSNDSGESFSASPETLDNTIYQVRLEISQLQADPLLHGFQLVWARPSSAWQWTDGLPANTWEEAISNPLIVTRTIRSPINAATGSLRFRVVVRQEFR